MTTAPRRRPRRWARAILVVASIGIADVAFTSLARAVGLYVPPSLREQAFRCAHPVYHHGLRANVERAPASWGPRSYHVSTNSLGCKDAAPREVDLRAAGRRVLLIGDSFTEGIGIDHEHTFAGVLARELAAEGTEVLNAGVVSYAPSIYLHKVRHLVDEVGLRVDVVAVCLDLSDIVDDVRVYKVEGGRVVDAVPLRIGEVFKSSIKSNTMLLRLLGDVWRGLREPAATPADALGLRNSKWTSDAELFEQFGRPGLRLATGYMDELAAFCRERGLELVLSVHPWPDQIQGREVDCVQRVHWRGWAAERGVEFVDLFGPFLDGDPETVLREYFIAGDSHWNEAGHALVARCLLPALR